MVLSDKVRFLEERADAFSKIYREEIERELRLRNVHFRVNSLTNYDWASSIENYFYSISLEGRETAGLILPFRHLLFHNLDIRDNLLSLDALNELSEKRGYQLEYHQFTWQKIPIIEGLIKGTLPEKNNRKAS